MKGFRIFGLWSILFFLTNAVQFKIGEGDGGGTGDPEPPVEPPVEPAVEPTAPPVEPTNDMASLPEWAQKQIKDLRTEAATNRTKNKGLEERFGNLEKGLKSALGLGDDDKATPEEQIKGLTSQNEDYSVRNAILEVAIENGLNGEQSDYFGFLLQKEGDSLEDDQELGKERYEELITLAKTIGGEGAGKSANTSIDGDGDQGNQGTGGNAEGSEITLEQFSTMTYGEKVSLRSKDEALYNKLFNEASSKGMI